MKLSKKTIVMIGANLTAATLSLAATPASAAACTFEANQKAEGIQGPPASAGAVIQMQHALYLIGLVTDYLDTNCGSDPDYSTAKANYDKLRNDVINTCRQVATDSNDCVAKRYGS